MKFVCDRCGKKYATAEDPAPGKVYKLKCKACGHLIVVKGQAGTMTGIPAITAAEVAMATAAQEPALTPAPVQHPEPAQHPEIDLHVEPEPPPAESPGTPLPGAFAPFTGSAPEPVTDDAIEPLPPPPDSDGSALPPEVALAVDGAAGADHPEPLAVPPELEPAPALDPALLPPSPDKDELADFAAAAAEVMAAPFATAGNTDGQKTGPGYVDLFGDITGQRELAARSRLTDAFSVAARASLPDSYTGAPPPGAAPTPDSRVAQAVPALSKAPARKSGLGGTPIAIVGLGMVALVGITAWALLGRGGAPAPRPVTAPTPVAVVEPPRPVEPEARPPAPAPATVVDNRTEEEKRPEPKAPEKRPELKPEVKPKLAEKRQERRPEPKVAEKKPEPPPAVQAQAQAQEPRTETRDVDLPDAAAALTQDVVNRVVGANRKAFTNCIANAKESGVALDGRRVALRITVNTNGTVTYPTLDDQSLNATEMGQCLKSAARLMIFPKFKGDPFHYEVPLILSGT